MPRPRHKQPPLASGQDAVPALAARVLSSSQHPITPGMIDDDALFVLRKLQEAGFAGYLVGGGVRDLYLGKIPKDFDISTNAHPGQIRKIFRNSMTIGRRFRLVQVFFRYGKVIEVSTLRSLDEHDLDGPVAVLAPNNSFGSLDEDAQRRDLTINSLFYEIENQTILDFVGGIDDLNGGVVRIVGDPAKRITRDPVRMLRAIRHAARIGFTIEPQSWQAICAHARELRLCPPSRLRDELYKDLHSGKLVDWFHLAVESGLFISLLEIYGEILDDESRGQACKEQLRALLAVIDRLSAHKTEEQAGKLLANHFLLALLLLPWAIQQFDCLVSECKGAAIFQFSKQLRAALDTDIGNQLNLPRATRQEIVSLIASLPIFLQHQQQQNWPAWLVRKSYFNNGLLFYHCYQESLGADPVDKALLYRAAGSSASEKKRPPSPPANNPDRPPASSTSGKRQPRPGIAGPVFAPDTPGGIFGFRKKS